MYVIRKIDQDLKKLDFSDETSILGFITRSPADVKQAVE